MHHRKLSLNSISIAALAAVCLQFTMAVAKAEPIEITAFALDRFHYSTTDKKAGLLEFIGGLELQSRNEEFGGFSGIRIAEQGSQLIAVSDTAKWLTAKITRDQNGKMNGLTNSSLNCLCGVGSKPYDSKHWGDSEGLELSGNRAFVSFERLNRINGYTLNRNYLPGDPKQATASFRKFEIAYNRGLEALALAPTGIPIAGKFLAIAEESPDDAGNHRAFIADDKKIEQFSITASGDYLVTDAAFSPNGNLLVLERRIGFTIGVGMRIRQFDGLTIVPGKTLSGEVLMEADLTSQIDNMEGLAVWQNAKDETILTLISDDNFGRLQRTILLEFKLPVQ